MVVGKTPVSRQDIFGNNLYHMFFDNILDHKQYLSGLVGMFELGAVGIAFADIAVIVLVVVAEFVEPQFDCIDINYAKVEYIEHSLIEDILGFGMSWGYTVDLSYRYHIENQVDLMNLVGYNIEGKLSMVVVDTTTIVVGV